MTSSAPSKKELIRQRALADLETFILLVHPGRVMGHCHRELIRWWTRQDAKSHQLVLLPRDHQKSALVAYRVAWEITKNPALRVLYISSTSKLAVKQLKFIKDILTCDAYRFYWPEMVNEDEAKREKWTETEIAVDHPERKKEAVRDPTIFTAGLTTNIVGLHCDIAVLDDVVVDDSAYTEEGRERVRTQVSYLASIAGTNSRTWAVGTRYHPKDLYHDLASQIVEMYGEDGEIEFSELLYEIHERTVETNGDGTGEYLWPRQQRYDGKWYGFDQRELAKKRAQYSDTTRFRAQYYNNPNDVGSASITRDMFQYFERKHLNREMGKWYYRHSRLNIFAAVDFAFSVEKKADYTAIAVIGVDSKHNYYILEIDRFKTNKISDYFDHILSLFVKWDFRKIIAETTVAQKVIVEDLKANYIRPHGLALVVEDSRPTKKKEERIEAILQPKYANKQVFHYMGGSCEILEEELVLQNPAHDDCKDAVANAISVSVPPSGNVVAFREKMINDYCHPRFGGVC